jgi:hypothetical protein
MESTVEEFRETVSAYDFSRFSTIVDVGGGQGGFLVAIIEHHPHIRGILFDLPEVVAEAPARLAPYPQREAIDIVGGDMFRDVPAGADAYLLSTVLRCFGDDQCRTVLGLCAERMAPGGHLLAVEMVLPEGIPPSPQGLADLQALAVYGGKDRTKAEWTTLLQQAGFTRPAFHPDRDPYAIIDAVRRLTGMALSGPAADCAAAGPAPRRSPGQSGDRVRPVLLACRCPRVDCPKCRPRL